MVRGTKIATPLARILAARTGHWLVAHVEAWHEKSDRRGADPGWFHPSSLASPCDALLAFDYLGIKQKKTFSAHLLRIFDNGSSRDKDWKRYLKHSGLSLIKTEEDRKIEIPELCIRGAIDDYVQNPLTKERYVFEFKTMNSSQWKGLRAPLHDHIIQVHPYMKGKDVSQTYFLYENKDNQEPKPFIYRFDVSLWAEISDRLLNILRLLEAGIMPQRTPARNESQCPYNYCCSGFELQQGGTAHAIQS